MSSPASPPPALSDFDILEPLGRGSFGTVTKVRRRSDGRLLVLKSMDYGSMRDKQKALLVSEVNILRELRHTHIVRYYDRIIDKAAARLYIVMEFCEGGDLGALLARCRREGTLLEEAFIWRVLAQTSVALRECHRHVDAQGRCRPVLHRDLKPGNLFLDAAANVKIGDFGLAKELASGSQFAHTSLGTPLYMSPEMISEAAGGYNEKSDIWALGCLLFELCAQAPPFSASNHLSLAVKIAAGKFPRIPPAYSDDLHRAIRWMLSLEPSQRPDVEALQLLPQVRAGVREAEAAGREYAAAAAAAAASRELREREAALAGREAALAAAEAALAGREAALQSSEAALAGREAALQRALREASLREARGAAREEAQAGAAAAEKGAAYRGELSPAAAAAAPSHAVSSEGAPQALDLRSPRASPPLQTAAPLSSLRPLRLSPHGSAAPALPRSVTLPPPPHREQPLSGRSATLPPHCEQPLTGRSATLPLPQQQQLSSAPSSCLLASPSGGCASVSAPQRSAQCLSAPLRPVSQVQAHCGEARERDQNV